MRHILIGFVFIGWLLNFAICQIEKKVSQAIPSAKVIVWDQSTLKKFAPLQGDGGAGYARMI